MCRKVLLVLMAGLLLLPAVGLASPSGTVEAVLTLTDVYTISCDETGLSGVEVLQADLDAWYLAGGDEYRSFGDFIVKILSLTDFGVLISQAAASTELATYPFANKDEVLRLLEDDGTTVIGWIPDTGGTLDISSHFTEANNAPGEAVTFYLEVSLNELGDRKAGEVITFTVTVALHDASV